MKTSHLLPALLSATLLFSAYPQSGHAQDAVIDQVGKLIDDDKYDAAEKLLLEAKKSLEARIAAEENAAAKIRLENFLADVHFQLAKFRGGATLTRLTRVRNIIVPSPSKEVCRSINSLTKAI